MTLQQIVGFAEPLISMAVPHGGDEINAIEKIIANPSIQTVDDLAVATEEVTLNYLPEDKAIFDGIIATIRGVEQTILAIEAKNAAPKAA